MTKQYNDQGASFKMRKNMKISGTVLTVLTACSIGVASAENVTGLTSFTSGSKAVASEVNANFNAVKTAVDDNDIRITTNSSDITALETENNLRDNRINNVGSTIKTLTAASWDADLNQPVVNQEWFWLDDCLTTSYMAGAGETALVTATMGIDFIGSLQGEVMVSSFPDGAAPTLGQHQRYFCRDCSFSNITVMDAIELTEGVTYQFGPVGFLQGSGPNITRLACQTMVQVVTIQQ